jgi:hypothetical protein
VAVPLVAVAAAVFCLARPDRPSSADPTNCLSCTEGLEASHLAREVERRCSELAARIDAIERRAEERAAVAVEAAERSSSRTAQPAQPSAAVSSDVSPPSDAAQDEDLDRLRETVFALIEEERKIRQEEAAQQAEERRREYEDLQKGPFGRFNFAVNSVAKKLELNDLGRQAYFEALTHSSDETAKAAKGVDWSDADARARYEARRKELDEEFDRSVKAFLTPAQAAAFDQLPHWQRQQGTRWTGQPGAGTIVIGGAGAGGAFPVEAEK